MKNIITLCLLIITISLHAQSFEVETIIESGPNDKRINYVILGDGYQETEMDKFINDAKTITNNLFTQSPYKEYKSFFNVYAVKVPSNESGAKHPGTATDVSEPKHPVLEVDNYFGSTFDYYNIHRLLVPTETHKITSVLASNVPDYDQVIILVNSVYYGGSGGAYATTSTETSANDIAIHELGHSFVGLADEYYAGDNYATEKINMTRDSNPSTVKWKVWLNHNGVGIHQHCCGGNSSQWYKPSTNCKMEYLSGSFCSVCKEATVKKIHRFVDMIDDYSPSNNEKIEIQDSLEFTLKTIENDPNTITNKWTLNNETVGEDIFSYTLKNENLIQGNNKLKVNVVDGTALLRLNAYSTLNVSSITWRIANDVSTSIEDVQQKKYDLTFYPNPTQDILYFKHNLEQAGQLAIINIQGQELLNQKFDKNNQLSELNIEDLKSGLYILKIRTNDGEIINHQIIKE